MQVDGEVDGTPEAQRSDDERESGIPEHDDNIHTIRQQRDDIRHKHVLLRVFLPSRQYGQRSPIGIELGSACQGGTSGVVRIERARTGQVSGRGGERVGVDRGEIHLVTVSTLLLVAGSLHADVLHVGRRSCR